MVLYFWWVSSAPADATAAPTTNATAAPTTSATDSDTPPAFQLARFLFGALTDHELEGYDPDDDNLDPVLFDHNNLNNFNLALDKKTKNIKKESLQDLVRICCPRDHILALSQGIGAPMKHLFTLLDNHIDNFATTHAAYLTNLANNLD